ncbi:lipoprotein-anchoring transpeptidase ErfK/SrfK [Oceanotoga teriensis]|jgi:lipoprotein-anchoring transpeptidase ErfK/SrfK|uniref:Lipoprotein-anchoring transpeptidase ErfK/SrfK n=1 Tax=Oceanotoga teriensis TaxID=515440 RepID=A0AA45C690_9BACT|nr:L,D-transpeptidase family protein [Oceanotoga teriensis]PWJ91221.1 lipoprotein-anchoring transpeptidase ErfK/SrfK [Oceanotoga teriensis]
MKKIILIISLLLSFNFLLANNFSLYIKNYDEKERIVTLSLNANFVHIDIPKVYIEYGGIRRLIEVNKKNSGNYEIYLNFSKYPAVDLSFYIYAHDIAENKRYAYFPDLLNKRDYSLFADIDITTSKSENGSNYYLGINKSDRINLNQITGENFYTKDEKIFLNHLNFIEDGIHNFYFEFKTKNNYYFTKKVKILKIKDIIITENNLKPKQKINIFNYHVVQSGDNIYKIAEKYEVTPGDIVSINGITEPSKIYIGQILKIGNIDYYESPLRIEIDLSKNMLHLYYREELLKSYIVAVGRSDSTPPGYYKIFYKEKEPPLYWNDEIIQSGSVINGIGSRWLQLSVPKYGIHGTTKPWEIGKRISHGCIRMFNFDVEELDFIISLGTEVYVYKSDENIDIIKKIKEDEEI